MTWSTMSGSALNGTVTKSNEPRTGTLAISSIQEKSLGCRAFSVSVGLTGHSTGSGVGLLTSSTS